MISRDEITESKNKNPSEVTSKMKNQENLQELQILEQTLQNILLQKQAFHMEASEISSALDELAKAGDDVFKIIGQLMIKSDKNSIKKDLEEKKKFLELRITNLEKQENSLNSQLEKIRTQILDKSK